MAQGYGAGGYGGPPGGYGGPPGGYGGAPSVGGVPSAGVPAAGGNYEFTGDQDQKIASLGTMLMVSGVMQILWGLGQGLTSWAFGFGQWLYNAPISLALMVIGVMFLLAGGSFKKIQQTQGNDVQHLMDAVGKLKAAMIVQVVGFVLAMIAGTVIMLLGFVFGLLVLASN